MVKIKCEVCDGTGWVEELDADSMDYLVYSKAQCGYCKKDLCEDCIGHEESSFSDYRGEIWCKKCWEIGNEYRPQIEKLNDKIEQLYDEWRNKCKG